MSRRRTSSRLFSLFVAPTLVVAVMALLYGAFHRPAPAANLQDVAGMADAESGAGQHDSPVHPAAALSLPVPGNEERDIVGAEPAITTNAVAGEVTAVPAYTGTGSAVLTPAGTTGNPWQLAGETRLADTPDLPFDPTAVIEQSRNMFQLDAAGRPYLHRPSHQAVFDGGQLRFTALIGENGEFFHAASGEMAMDTAVSATPLTLNVALARVAAGNQDIPLAAAPVYEAADNMVRASRGEHLIEEFVARDADIEQQWRLEKQLDASGDLTLTILVETPLMLAQAGADFVFQVGTANGEPLSVIQYSRALAIDANGATQWAEAGYEQIAGGEGTNRYHLSFRFSEEWLAAAAYPLLIDPLISNLIRLEQVSPASNQSLPEITYNPNENEFLLVWQDYRNSNWDIYGQRVSGGGALLDENFIITNALYQQSNPHVAYGNGVYLVAWRHHPGSSSTAYDVYGGIISGTGEIVSNNLLIAANGSRREQPTDVVFNSSSGQFLVLWQEQGTYWDIWGRHVAADGSLGSAVQIAAQASWHKENAAVAYNAANDQYLVVWRRHNGGSTNLVEGRRLNGNGSVLGSNIDISSGTGQEREPDVIYLPSVGRYVVVWSDNRNNSTNSYDIYGQQVTPAGALSGNNFAISAATSEERLPRLAADAFAGGALLVWQHNGGDYDLYSRLLDASGAPDGGSFAIQLAKENQTFPILAQNGDGDFLVAWQDNRYGNDDIFMRLRLAGGSWGGAGLAHPAPGDQEKLQIAYNPDDDEYLVVWQDFRNSIHWDIYGQRVDGDGSLLGTNIAMVSTTGEELLHRTNPQVAYGANKYLVVWQHYTGSNTTYDVYGRLLNRGGSFATNPFAIANVTDSGKAVRESPNDVVFNSNSNQFLVVWQVEASSNNWDIWGRHVSATGSIGAYIQISNTSSQYEQQAAVAYNPDNDQYLLVWEWINGTVRGIQGQRMTGGGTLSGGTIVIVSSPPSLSASFVAPDVAYLPASNRYLAVWQHDAPGGVIAFDIVGRVISPTGTLLTPVYPIADTTSQEMAPDLAVHDAGALVIWQRQNGGSSGYDLYGRLLDSSGWPADGPVVVLEAEGDQQNGAIAYGGNNRYLVAWQDNREEGWDLYAALFTPTRDWRLVSTITLTPTVSGEYAMAFDSQRNVTVLYGGNHTGWPYQNDTWEFNGVDWANVATSQRPPAVYGAAMAHDNNNGRMALFGGSSAADVTLGQTWLYDGLNWTQQLTTNSPPARSEHRLVYAATAQKIFLFGGRNGATYYNDVWQYDGANWTQVTVSGPSPAARSLHALAYNPANNTILLFGGRDVAGVLLADTWSFNPATSSWTQLSAGPAGRQGHSLVYDPIQLRLVLVGGMAADGDTLLDDTWSYQEGGWTNANTIPAAPAGVYHTLVYDSSDNALILFTNGQTWQYR